MIFQCTAWLFEKVDITYHSTTPLLYGISKKYPQKSVALLSCQDAMPRRLLLYCMYTAVDPPFSKYTISLVLFLENR
jgi:hypothetical protein